MDDNLLLKDAHMVYELLRAGFGSEKWRKEHEDMEDGYKISVMSIDYMSEADVDESGARKMSHSFDVTTIGAHDRGARDLFSFEAARANCLQSRVFSCWCMGCVLSGSVSYTAGLPAAIRSCFPVGMELAREWGQCEHLLACEAWESQEIQETSERGVVASNSKFRQRAEAISNEVQEKSVCAVECWDQMESEHIFFLCEVLTHPDGSVLKKAPSLAGKKKHTDNGQLSQPMQMHDPLFAARIFLPDPTNNTSAGLAFTKSNKVVVVNGRGFRYRIQTGEFVVSNQPAPTPRRTARRTARCALAETEALAPGVIYHLDTAALETIRCSLYAQGR